MKKDWGLTEPLIVTPLIEVHRLTILPFHRCSWHMHNRKWNAFIVLSGVLVIEDEGAGNRAVLDTPGDYYAVHPGDFHCFITGGAPTVALEIYYPAALSEDIVRRDLGGAYKALEDVA